MRADDPGCPGRTPTRPAPARRQTTEALSLAALLQRSPLLSVLDAYDAEALACHTRKRLVSRHTVLLRQGERGRHLWLQLSGQSHSFRADDRDREVILDLHGPGAFFGAESLIDGGPHPSSLRTDEDCDFLEIPGGALAGILARHPGLAMTLTLHLNERLRRCHRRIASLAHQEVGERLLDRLSDLAEHGPEGLVLRRALPRQHLARMIGASREMVSRTMKQLEITRAIEVRDDGSIRLNRPPDGSAA